MSLAVPSTGVLSGPLSLSTDGILAVSAGIYVTSIDVPYVGDEGGWPIVATGSFPVGVPLAVHIVPVTGTQVACYSGVQDREYDVYSTDGATISFVAPPLPAVPTDATWSNPYAILVTSTVTSYLAPAILTVVHRSYTTRLYSTRQHFPPPRLVGPYDPESEDYDG